MALGTKVVVYLRGKPILNGCLQGRIIGIKSGLAVFTTLTPVSVPQGEEDAFRLHQLSRDRVQLLPVFTVGFAPALLRAGS